VSDKNGKKLSEKVRTSFGKKIYKFYLKTFGTNKNPLSEFQLIGKLLDIDNYFHLPPNFTKSTKQKSALRALHNLSLLKLNDQHLSTNERNDMYSFGEFLGIDKAKIDEVNTKNAKKIFQQTVNQFKADRRITPQEEQELTNLMQAMGLSEEDVKQSAKTEQELTYFKLLYEVENGKLPEIQVPFVLKQGEKAHFASSADLLVNVTEKYKNSKRKTEKREVTYKYNGTLIVSNQRIVFSATQKGFDLPFTKLTNFEIYKEGCRLQKNSDYLTLRFSSAELFGKIVQVITKR
jgi:hypothetical protein